MGTAIRFRLGEADAGIVSALLMPQVTFEDLINGLSVLNQKATREQKLMLSFHLLDPEGTGYITKKMTTDVLRSCLAEWRGMEGAVPVELDAKTGGEDARS